MRRVISLVSIIGAGALLAAACGDDADVINTARGGSGGTGGRPGLGGSSGRPNPGTGGTGLVPSAGTGGSGGSALVDAGDAGDPDASGVLVDAGDAGDAGVPCIDSATCGSNACATGACVGGFCQLTPVGIGTACGSATSDECTQPDTCDGNGVCLTNDAPGGATCATGHCNLAGVCDCAVDRVTALPYGQQWQTTAETETDSLGECQTCGGTLDHIVVFTAPAAGNYRFDATSIGGDVQLAVYPGDCNAAPSGATCGIDDAESGFDTLELALEAGAVVTVVVGENCEAEGSEGNLSIELAPDDG